MNKSGRAAILLVLAILSLGLAGCSWKGGPAESARLDEADTWSPAPTQIRVYPSSRFAQGPDGVPLLETRVELLDSMGDSTKAAGEYRVELLRTTEEGMGERLYAWDVTVRTMAEQARHYDKVTRTYLLRLKLDDASLPRQPVSVRVTFTPLVGDHRLWATLPLRQ